MKPPAPRHLCWISALILIIALAGHATSQYLASGFGEKYPVEQFFDPPVVKLLHTLQRGNSAAAKQQIAEGVSLNVLGFPGKERMTPMFWLLLNNDKTAFRLALQLGAYDPNFRDQYGDTLVNDLAGSQLTDYLEIVLQAGGDPNVIGNRHQPALFRAIDSIHQLENVKLLVKHGANINLTDKLNRNAALYAAYLNQYSIILWLIEQGADIHSYNTLGSNIANTLQFTISMFENTGSPVNPDALKLKSLLIQRGVKFPPLTPFEVRAMWQAGKQPDDGSSPPGMVKQ